MHIKPEILVETDDFVAINKPAGLLSVPDRLGVEVSLKQLLQEKYGQIFTVHRLDKETSGVIVFAKNESAHKQLSQLFEGRNVEKYYLGLVHANPINKSGSIDAPLMESPGKPGRMITHKKGKASLTDYTVLEDFRLFSWLQFQIHTGRTHQIRVHMQHIGHPIVCDELYGTAEPIKLSAIKKNYKLSKQADEERPILSRLALHSAQLKFNFNGTAFDIEAPLSKDLKALLQQLRKR